LTPTIANDIAARRFQCVVHLRRTEETMTSSERPKDGQIKVCLESGANIHSSNDAFVEAEDLGFESRAEWDAASEEEKFKAVQDYFNGNGYPEYSWDDGSD
jgi:hypothetical protein